MRPLERLPISPSLLHRVRDRHHIAYLVGLLAVSAYYVVRWPIVAHDTDVWYHLSAGRYMANHKAIPATTFFSFLAPLREWTDYFWLFQLLTYAVHSLTGYQGLIVLRTIVFLATMSVVLLYLIRETREDGSGPYCTTIFALYLVVLVQRDLLVRPHAWSYLFIAIFLYILEFQPRRTVYLPLLAVLWANLHGIAYPLMLVITLAYGAEFVVDRIRGHTEPAREGARYPVALVASMYAVFATPHGVSLLGVPFGLSSYASRYIQELLPISLGDLLSFRISTQTFAFSYGTMVNLLLALACMSLVSGVVRRAVRLSHVLLFGTGLALLTMGVRFRYEFALFALPIVKAHGPIFWDGSGRRPGPWVQRVGAAVLTAMAIATLHADFHIRPRYPLSPKNLPVGVTAFLRKVDAGGAVLNRPGNGGYLQWVLFPRYRIFMDMQVPFFFTDEDMYTVTHVFGSEAVLKRLVARYDPSFIMAPISREEFRPVIRMLPEYVPVMFDDVDVLYVNSRHYSELASRYAVRRVDPFLLASRPMEEAVGADGRDEAVGELERLNSIYPGTKIINRALAILLAQQGAYDRALHHVDAVVEAYPESPEGYDRRGDILMGLGKFEGAAASYRAALARTEAWERPRLYKSLGTAYLRLEQYEPAYRALKRGVDPFSVRTTHRELFDLGLAALFSERLVEARAILRFGYQKVPSDDAGWAARYREVMASLGIDADER